MTHGYELAVALEPPPGTALLYPSAGARELTALAPDEHPRALIVLDGTWSQAGKLYRANPWLGALPHYVLAPAAPTRYRIRLAPRPSYLSTIEAIVAALGVLELETPGLGDLIAVLLNVLGDLSRAPLDLESLRWANDREREAAELVARHGVRVEARGDVEGRTELLGVVGGTRCSATLDSTRSGR